MQEQVGGQGNNLSKNVLQSCLKSNTFENSKTVSPAPDAGAGGRAGGWGEREEQCCHHQNHQKPLLFAPAISWSWLWWSWWASPKAPTPWCWSCHLKISPFHNLTFAENRKVLKSGNKCFSSYLRDRRFLRIHGEGWMREEWFQSWTFYYKYEGSKLKDLVLMSQIMAWVVFTMISQI